MPFSLNFVLKTNPKHLSEDIPLDKVIEVDLMVDLNPNEFKESHVMLYNMTERKDVPIRAEYRPRTIQIQPLTKLNPRTHYEVTLLGGEGRGLKTITGRFLEQSYIFEFYTKDVVEIKPPTVTSPTHLTEVFDNVTFKWLDVPNAFYYELEVSRTNTFHSLVWPTEENVHVYDGSATPNIAYTKGTYYARIRSIDRDRVCSSWSDPIQFYYNGETKAREEQEPIAEENISTATMASSGEKRKFSLQTMSSKGSGPTQISALQQILATGPSAGSEQLYIAKTIPKHDSLNLPLTQLKEIVIEFSDKVDPDSITRETVYLIAEKN